MENKEDILDALNDFDKKTCTEIPPLLEQYLQQVAKTGKTWFPWDKLKKLFVTKVDMVMTQFTKDSPTDLVQSTPNVESVKYEDMRKRILALMEDFQGAPFTVQRLCELIIEPKRHYKRCDKFLRGVEKNVSVVSTVDPFGRKIVSESQAMVNGLDSNGFNETLSKPNPFSSFPTPTQSSWTASIDKWFGTTTDPVSQSDNQPLSGDGDLTEQKEIEGVESCEMETSGTSSSDGDSNDEDVFTANSTKSSENDKTEEKNESPNVVKTENSSQEEIEKSDLLGKVQENTDDTQQEPELAESQSSNNKTIISVSEIKDEPQADIAKQPDEGISSSSSGTTEQISSDNTATESTQCDDKQKTGKQSNQALDICMNAQNILDRGNKACSEAEETFSIAQQVCDSDQKQQSESSEQQVTETSVEQSSSELPVESSSIEQSSSELPVESSSIEQSSKNSVEKSTESSAEKSPENVDQNLSKSETEQSIKHSIQQSTDNIDSHLVEASNKENKSNVLEQSSECDQINTDIVQEPSECDDCANSVCQAKKPRLQLPNTSESETMDVDSNEYSDSSNNVNESSLNVAQSDSKEQARIENLAQVDNTEDTPMEQD